MVPNYRLAFDAADQPLVPDSWMFLLIPVLLTGVGALMVFRPALMQRLLPGGLQGGPRRVFSWVYFLFAGSMTVVTFASTVSGNLRARHALDGGEVSIVEGCLQSFHPMPFKGHDVERIRVGGRCFAYSDYTLGAGFHHTESHGGPIHADSRVRLTYSGGAILKVEALDHACPTAPDDIAKSDGCGRR